MLAAIILSPKADTKWHSANIFSTELVFSQNNLASIEVKFKTVCGKYLFPSPFSSWTSHFKGPKYAIRSFVFLWEFAVFNDYESTSN